MRRLPTIPQRVAKGAALLDAYQPGWELEIHLPDLDMGHPLYCVLGQLKGKYSTGRRLLEESPPEGFDLPDHRVEDEPTWPEVYGFLPLTASADLRLTKEWTRVIGQRHANQREDK